MKKVEIEVYTYSELDEKAKAKAREWWRECAGQDEWWDAILDDARQVGIDITKFDIYRREIGGNFLPMFDIETSRQAVKLLHGNTCRTYKIACQGGNDDEYLVDMLEEYLKMLEREYNYYFSDEHVTEAIEANEYDFTKDGKVFIG